MIALATSRQSRLLDPYGRPIARARQPVRHLVEMKRPLRRDIQARYDAAQTGSTHGNYWANADTLDADSANSQAVRATLVKRSRYEAANNGYAAGIARTYAADLVGRDGPQLRMETGSNGFNRMIELEWYRWSRAVQLRRKLVTMALAKHVDGEAFGVLRRNPRVGHAIRLDLQLYETEQCQSPWLPYNDPRMIDGIELDQFGNPLFYFFLREHPGSGYYTSLSDAERVPAEAVLHWFRMSRPGQHRGVPECVSTLNLGAGSRRLREATLTKAEVAARHTAVVETAFQPDEMDLPEPLSTVAIEDGMLTALPAGNKLSQLKSEAGDSQYADFIRSQISEMARPISMPFNKAACDSASYNYASGRLDHQTYYQALDIERNDANDAVLDPLFAAWFDLAVVRYGWLGGDPAAISPAAREHSWDWPQHQVADEQARASAIDKSLKNGTLGIREYMASAGKDWEDEVARESAAFGVSEDEYRRAIFNAIFNATNQQASMQQAENQGAANGQE